MSRYLPASYPAANATPMGLSVDGPADLTAHIYQCCLQYPTLLPEIATDLGKITTSLISLISTSTKWLPVN